MAATLVSYSPHNSFCPTNNSKINIRRDWFPALVNTPSHDTKEEDVRAKKQSPATAKSLRLCCGIKRAFGLTKLNIDGSVQEISGCGGLFRDHRGLPICGFISNAPNNNIFIVELWAICKGLDVGLRLGIPRIWVEFDSLSVVKTVNREQAYGLEATNYLRLVWDLMGKFERCQVTQAWRETNRAVDQLAKMAVSESEELTVRGGDLVLVVYTPGFPDKLHEIISEDGLGKIYVSWFPQLPSCRSDGEIVDG